MRSTQSRFVTRLRRGVLTAALLVVVALALAPAAPAARSGRVAPESRWSLWAPGRIADAVVRDASVQHWIYDAQPSGTLALTRTEVAPEATLVATDATGATVWSVETGDAWAATGTLPAAFVATFPDPDPNVLRSGELRAYNADGTIRFRRRSRTSSSSRCATRPSVWSGPKSRPRG